VSLQTGHTADLTAVYTKALINEIKLKSCQNFITSNEIETIYFGGGTPSILSIKLIEQILSALYKHFKIDKACEITMEVNPGTIDKKFLGDLKTLGVNRLNIGVQSFNDEKLKFLGRIHSAEQAENAIAHSRDAGFENIGIDLIYGIPHQSKKSFISDLAKAISYKLEHLSCYMLTFEKNTQLYNKLKQGKIKSVAKEELSDFFIKTSDFLTLNNYVHYEISNFAAGLNHRSIHNSNYWNQTSYHGFGASAHSFDKKTRFWNHPDIKRYINDLDKEVLPMGDREILTSEQTVIEMIMLGLRCKNGINLKKLEGCFNNILAMLEKEKLGMKNHNRFALTQKGMCHLDDITQLFVDFI